MILKPCLSSFAVTTLFAMSSLAQAQQGPLPYGPPISLEQAKQAMVAAEAEAKKNNWNVAMVVVDSGGHMVMMQKIDNTQTASIEIAAGKAVTAVNFKRPTKAMEDTIAAGGAGLRLLSLKGVTPLEGGVLVVKDGKIIGAVGVSGVQSGQDAQVAKAGADAVK